MKQKLKAVGEVKTEGKKIKQEKRREFLQVVVLLFSAAVSLFSTSKGSKRLPDIYEVGKKLMFNK